ncbi:uncharacterized protein LOC106073012 [Biomphalaria glabrata]|uniref:Uncharacterized protein LOC106073012 n=1 Tax=Biomphalaria glabrata TaxID=6526 RepID=A0A9W2Z382_BIOGL|nr:uncharacterized protein LOC106073012 [Biomphalaria glabrata]
MASLLIFISALALSAGKSIDNSQLNTNDGGNKVFDLVLDTVNKTTKGLTSTELKKAAKQIESLSDGVSVKVEELNDFIKKVSKKTGTTAAINELLEDALSFDAELLNDFLAIWTFLAKSGKEKIASSQPVDLTIAGIGKISVAVQQLLADIVRDVKYTEKENSTGAATKEEDVILQYDQVGDTKEEREMAPAKQMEKRRVRIRCGWWSRCVING